MSKLESYYRISQVTGVHLHLLADGGVALQVCSVIANGSQLQIDQKVTDLTAVGQLKEHLPAKSIIAIDLSGKGVLQKQVEKTEVVDQSVFNKILPNAKIDDFYVQNFISGELSFVSLIRKTEADKWIGQLRELEYQPLMLSLGPFAVDSVISQLNIYEQEFTVNGHQVRREKNGHWLGYQYVESAVSPFPYKLASEKIDEKLLIPYAAAFQLVLCGSLETVNAGVEDLEAALEKKLSDQKLKVQAALMLVILFGLLLVNFVLFSWLNSSNQHLREQVSRYARNTSNQQEITEQVNHKEARLKELGWDGGINKSVLMDQIASLLPPEVTLKEIAVNPVDASGTRTQKTILFSDRKISVTGTSERIIPVNEWIARVKSKRWVKNIQLDYFAFNSEINTGQFTITIDY